MRDSKCAGEWVRNLLNLGATLPDVTLLWHAGVRNFKYRIFNCPDCLTNSRFLF